MNIAVLCPPLAGHLHPIAVLGRALIARGHQVTVFQFEEFRPQVEAEHLDFCRLGPSSGSLHIQIGQMGHAKGVQSLREAVDGARKSAENICTYGPAAFRDRSIDLVLVDQNEPAGGTVAEYLQIPFLSLCPSLPLNREPAIPPPFVGWAYADSFPARLRNAIGIGLADLLIAPINRALNRYREKWSLRPIRTPDDSFSPVAQLSQMVRELDFPRRSLPNSFHYLGPWLDLGRESNQDFPFHQLDGRPLVYASFGTLQPGASRQFANIAEACHRLNLQLTLATGAACANLKDLPGKPIVVPYAPQLELLPKSRVVVTHGGMNTVMQSLYFGKSMLVIPQTHDQPAIASRVSRAGAGLILTPGCTAVQIQKALEKLLSQTCFGLSASTLQCSILKAGGIDLAIRLVESMGQGTSKPGLQD